MTERVDTMKHVTTHEVQHGNATIKYLICGGEPALCLGACVHGDESKVKRPMIRVMRRMTKVALLPDYICIPEVSPSAVRLQTRKNAQGVDVNRAFFDDSPVEEVQANMMIFKSHHVKVAAFFHMDYIASYFYSHVDLEGSEILGNLRREFRSNGIPLYTGVDDENDPLLRLESREGYIFDPPKETYDGQMVNWLHLKGLADRVFDIEISTLLSFDQQCKAVSLFMQGLILPFLS
jgi:hypothetical protein